MKENLDYTDPENVVNFRDVGEYINLISGTQMMPVGKLYRGGTIKYIKDGRPIKNPRTIFLSDESRRPSDRRRYECPFPRFQRS